MKQRFLSIFLALSLIVPFLPQITLPAKAAETTAKTQDENSNENTDAFGIKMDTKVLKPIIIIMTEIIKKVPLEA